MDILDSTFLALRNSPKGTTLYMRWQGSQVLVFSLERMPFMW